jgi:hypothetical protein
MDHMHPVAYTAIDIRQPVGAPSFLLKAYGVAPFDGGGVGEPDSAPGVLYGAFPVDGSMVESDVHVGSADAGDGALGDTGSDAEGDATTPDGSSDAGGGGD